MKACSALKLWGYLFGLGIPRQTQGKVMKNMNKGL